MYANYAGSLALPPRRLPRVFEPDAAELVLEVGILIHALRIRFAPCVYRYRLERNRLSCAPSVVKAGG